MICNHFGESALLCLRWHACAQALSGQLLSFCCCAVPAADHLFVFEGDGKIKDFPGNYTEYRAWREERDREEKLAAATKPAIATSTGQTESAPTAKLSRGGLERAQKLTFKERKEFEELTSEIDRLNNEKQQLEELFNSGEAISDIDAKSRRYTELKDILDEKEMRWLELSEKA